MTSFLRSRPSLARAALAAALVAAALLPNGLPAQQGAEAGPGAPVFGVALSTLGEPQGDVVGGPGLHAWLATEWRGLVRFGLTAGIDRGRATRDGTTCAFYWPAFEDCLGEPVEWAHDVRSAMARLEVLTPRIRGFRASLGATNGYQWVDISREGVDTGRQEAPIQAREGRLASRGWTAALEHHGFLGGAFQVELRYADAGVDFGCCIMDTWTVPGEVAYRRWWLGVGVPLGE